METPENAVLLRIYMNEGEKWHHQPLYEAIVMKAREMGMAGATVLRGPMGYGRSHQLHTAKILDLSVNLPVVVEIVESQEKIAAFRSVLSGMMTRGLVTEEKVAMWIFNEPAGN